MSHRMKLTLFVLAFNVIGFASKFTGRVNPENGRTGSSEQRSLLSRI
jgi:hypothetical protein